MSFGSFAKPTGSLFGNTTTNAGGTTQPQSSLFNTTPQQTQQQQQSQQGGSLFGSGLFSQPQQNQQPTTTNSLFSSTLGQQQPQQQQQMAQPSLFGGSGQSTMQQNAPQQQQNNPSLFGNASTTQSQQSSLFPGNNNTALSQSTAGFGNNQLQRQPTLPSLGFSTNTLLNNPSQQPNAQSNGALLFARSTKFNDLPDEIKRTLESIETHIQGRVQISNDLKQRKIGEEAAKEEERLRDVQKELLGVVTVLQNDIYHTHDVKAKVDQTAQDTIAATRIIDGFRNPQQNGHFLKTHASFPLEFFERVTEEMRSRLRWYKMTIEQIERKLSSVASQTQPTPHAISSTLQAQHATFVALVSKTAALDAELQKIKALYTQLWRAKTGSRRDPFNELDRGIGEEFGMDSLSGR